jgi:acetyl esterase/lipase
MDHEPTVIGLWPGPAPDEPGELPPELWREPHIIDPAQVEIAESSRLLTNVSRPTLTVCRPPAALDTGTAVVICPGGGYWDLYWQLEGEEPAAWLNTLGITGLILKYRVPRRPGEPERLPARRPLQDAQRALRLARARAGELGIAPNRLGIMGFSAGGHLALAAATRFGERSYEPLDAVDEVSCRPDFAIAAYSGYLKPAEAFEPTLVAPPDAPPVFLVHGGADPISDAEHSVVMYLALKRAGIPAELHVYGGAVHDFGVRAGERPCFGWTAACAAWLRHAGMLPEG